jgi:cytochrome c oxidase cbb3-type subunit 3
MSRFIPLTALSLVALISCNGCERERRRIQEPAAMNTPVKGPIQNPEVYPGPVQPEQSSLQPQPGGSPYENNAFLVASGQQLYQDMNCVGCHADGGGGMGPALMDVDWIYGSDPKSIYETIVEGRPNGMPSYAGKLTAYQVWQLVAYVRSMSGMLRKDVSPGRTDHMEVKPSEADARSERKSGKWIEGGH